MKDYSQIISHMKGSLWLIEENSLITIVDIVNRRLSGDKLDDEEIRLRIEAAENGDRSHERVEVGGGVGIVPVYGPMFPKSNLMTELSGATSLEAFRNDLNGLLENDKVKSIVLDIDSPGGVTDMVSETGAEIRAARDIKPIYAVANTVSASAAYWLMSQATKAYSTPSGKVGSVGVCSIIEDVSERDKSEGRKINVFTTGPFKATGNPHVPLTEEVKAYVQEHIDELHEQFVDTIAQGRNLDRDKVIEFADGRLFSATKALELGMIDDVKSLSSVVDSLLAENKVPNVRSTLSNAMAKHHANVETFTTSAEVAEKEHSEPGTGTGGEPEPRPQEGDLNTERQHRRDTPPIVHELEENMEELLTQLRAAGVELPEDASEGDVVSAFANLQEENKNLNDEVAPIRAAAEGAEKKIEFRKQFPEEAARLERLEKATQESDAKAFSGRFTRFQKPDSDEKLPHGFSALALEKVEDAYLSIVRGDMTVQMLDDLLSTIGVNGIVDYTEKGSSRRVEGETPVVDPRNPRQAFAEAVAQIMEQDELDRNAALRVAAEKYPELYEAYRATPSGRP